MPDPDLGDLSLQTTYHTAALPGREFILRTKTCRSGVLELRADLIMSALKTALQWRNKAEWIELLDFERKVVVSRTRMWRLWRAADGHYGKPAGDSTYVVRGPTLNPTFFERYWTRDLLMAIDFAVYWRGSCWNEPYWCEVRGPNSGIVLSAEVAKQMHYAEVKAKGGSIVEMLVSFDAVAGQATKVWERHIG